MRVEHASGGAPVRATVLVLVGEGDRVRLDVLSPAGSTLQTMVASPEGFTLLDAAEDRFLRGAASPCNLGRILPLGLGPGEIARVLKGEAPLVAPAQAEVAWDAASAEEGPAAHAAHSHALTRRPLSAPPNLAPVGNVKGMSIPPDAARREHPGGLPVSPGSA